MSPGLLPISQARIAFSQEALQIEIFRRQISLASKARPQCKFQGLGEHIQRLFPYRLVNQDRDVIDLMPQRNAEALVQQLIALRKRQVPRAFFFRFRDLVKARCRMLFFEYP
jgi:hypothetical protein